MLDTKEIDITLRKLKNNQWFQKQSKVITRELEHSWLKSSENLHNLQAEVKEEMVSQKKLQFGNMEGNTRIA